MNQALGLACELTAPTTCNMASAELDGMKDDPYAPRLEIMSAMSKCRTITLSIPVTENYWTLGLWGSTP